MTVLRMVEEAARTDAGRQRHANEDSYSRGRRCSGRGRDGRRPGGRGRFADRRGRRSSERTDDGSPEQQLARVAHEANRRIFELAQRGLQPQRHGHHSDRRAGRRRGGQRSSTSATAAPTCIRDGKLRQLTRDHSLVEELRRQGRLTSEEAEEHPQRSVITRALGSSLTWSSTSTPTRHAAATCSCW